MSPLRIFLADDHTLVRDGVKRLINDNPEFTVIGEAGDGQIACDEAISLQPDVAVIDVSMPRLNGIEITRRIRKSCPNTKVLAMTVQEDAGYIEAVMAAGASGYLLKRAAAQELINAIKAVGQGEIYMDPEVASKLMANSSSLPRAGESKRPARLSARETEVLQMVAKGHTSKEIGVQMCLSEKSIETYKSRAMSKLGLHGRADVVRYAIGKDWLNQT